MSLPPIPFKDIAAAAQPYAEALGNRWVGGLKKFSQGWKACCPFHSERTPSWTLYADGHSICFGCGVKAMDLIDLYEKTQNVSKVEAARAVARVVGHPFGESQ